MKYVAAASDKTVSLRREPFWVFRIFVKCNIASCRTTLNEFVNLRQNLTTDEHGFDRLKTSEIYFLALLVMKANAGVLAPLQSEKSER
jgi:hypothetical protein